jgi:hypothetical protein
MAVASSQVTTRLPEFQEQYVADLLESAQNLFKPVAEGGKGLSMPFVQQQLAGLSEGQQQAIQQALGGVGAFQPFLTESKEALTSGLGQAQALAAGAGMDPNAYKAYMDPFLDDVVQRAQDDIGRQGRMQERAANAQAVGSGAFGGSRAAVLQGEIGRNTLEQQARTGERLRSAGFSQASKLAQDAAAQQLRQAQLTGGLAQGLAGGIAQLGMQGQQMGTQDINTLLGIGGLQQGQAQQALNVAQQNALAQQQLPFQQLGFLGDIFRGVPALQQQTTQTYTPPPSLSSQLLGLGIAGLGAFGAFEQ